jgi:RNA polymerase sigma-70 factor, ECF subfamily
MRMSAHDDGKARRFRDAALPHVDDMYALARYLLRDTADAEDAVQESCLRAFRHFDGFRGAAIKPWLLAILRNVCRAEWARRAGAPAMGAVADDTHPPLWCEEAGTPEMQMLRRLDADRLERLILALPDTFREVLVLREINELDYRGIAEVIDAPIGTVMSRLARARALLRAAWLDEQGNEER